jgi:hypothetical protein
METYLTMDEVAQMIKTQPEINTYILFEEKELLFQIKSEPEQIVINLNPGTSCLRMSIDIPSKTTYLDSLMYQQFDKTQCSAWDQPGYGGFFITSCRCVEYCIWDVVMQIVRCCRIY